MAEGEDEPRENLEHDVLVEIAALRDDLKRAHERIATLELSLDHMRSTVVASATKGLEVFQKTTMKDLKLIEARVNENTDAVSRVNRRTDALSEDTAAIVVRLEDLKDLLEGVDTVTLENATAKNAQLAQDNKEHLKQLAALLRTLERSMNRESKTVKEDLDRVERDLKLVRRLDSRMEILENHKDDIAGRFAELTDVLESVRTHIVSGGERALPAEYNRLEKERSKLERRLDDVVAHITKKSGK